MHHELPARLDLEHYRKEAKALARAWRAGDEAARARVAEALPGRRDDRFALADAQRAIAAEHGHRTWAAFRRAIEVAAPEPPVARIGREPVAAYEARAEELVARVRAGDDDALRRVSANVPSLSSFAGGELALRDARVAVAREYGFPTWRDLVHHVEKAIREYEPQRGGAPEVVEALEAIRAGDVAGLEALLDREPWLAGDVHRGAWATLLEAIAQPDAVGDGLERELGTDPAVVRLLAARGSALDVPLGIAACFNRVELVELLLELGANPADREIWGVTPLQTAIYHGAREAADVLVPHGLLPDAFYVACGAGALDAVRSWFDAAGRLRREALALRPNLADVGWNPAPPPRPDPQDALDEGFALAAFSGRLETMELLLAHGASVDGAVHLGLTAMHMAVIARRADVVAWLLDRGADLTCRDGIYRGTPLGWAEHHEDGDARWTPVASLIRGADPSLARLRAALAEGLAGGQEQATVVLETEETYGAEPVRVTVRKRGRRYRLGDGGRAVELAGRPEGWLAAAERVVAQTGLNVNRRGEVFVPAVEGRDLASLARRVAITSRDVLSALL
jgi:hypothetical protein